MPALGVNTMFILFGFKYYRDFNGKQASSFRATCAAHITLLLRNKIDNKLALV